MKKRTKEENAAYGRAQREKKRLAAVSPSVSPKAVSPRITSAVSPKIVSPTPCPSCATHSAALATAQERISMLEEQLAAARRTATPSHKVKADDAEAFRQRVIAEKTNRINTFGRNPSIGVARI